MIVQTTVSRLIDWLIDRLLTCGLAVHTQCLPFRLKRDSKFISMRWSVQKNILKKKGNEKRKKSILPISQQMIELSNPPEKSCCRLASHARDRMEPAWPRMVEINWWPLSLSRNTLEKKAHEGFTECSFISWKNRSGMQDTPDCSGIITDKGVFGWKVEPAKINRTMLFFSHFSQFKDQNTTQ